MGHGDGSVMPVTEAFKLSRQVFQIFFAADNMPDKVRPSMPLLLRSEEKGVRLITSQNNVHKPGKAGNTISVSILCSVFIN